MIIRPALKSDVKAIKDFTDQNIGKHYFSESEIEEILDLSEVNGKSVSFICEVEGELAGVRLTYAPGTWLEKKGRGLTPKMWKVSSENTGYFKSLFVGAKFQQMGIGKQLSGKSIEVLRELGAEAILCHSWLESPGNSSQKYLMHMGFEAVTDHPRHWYPIDYECVRCAPEKCICTAREMILYLG